MQIHEITEAVVRNLPRVPVKTGIAQRAQQRTVVPATQPTQPASAQPTQSQSASLGGTDYAQQFADYLLHKNPAFASVPRYNNGSYFVEPGGSQPAPARPVAQTASAPVATPKTMPVATQPPVAPVQYPPITLGSGPKAQVFVNKGRGYVDSKTGKPMPSAVVQAMGIK
jgi:hypothetical protein